MTVGWLSEARRQLAMLARRKTARVLGWPRDWRPGSVINPLTGAPFTEAAAWQFIADVLETRHDVPLTTVAMQYPGGGGKTGYVLVVEHGDRRIYIKLQLGAGKVIGRSFHYSQSDQTE